jgi:hypothetical protein
MIEEALTDGGVVISKDLGHAQEPEEVFRLLKHFGFTDQDIAEGTCTDPRTVRRWKSAEPGTATARRLAEIRNVVLLLREGGALTDRGIVFWMRHPNRLLEDYSPLAVIGGGGFHSVTDAAKCFSDSERGFDEPLPAGVLEQLREQNSAGVQKRRDKSTRSRSRANLEPVG